MKKIAYYLLASILISTACSPIISNFDRFAYKQITSLKVDALSLMDEATSDYASHAAEVKTLQSDLNKAIEYNKHRLHNDITNKMYALLNDPEANLLGGFLVKWQNDGKCSPAYITDKKRQIAFSFDQIADLEIRKIKH